MGISEVVLLLSLSFPFLGVFSYALGEPPLSLPSVFYVSEKARPCSRFPGWLKATAQVTEIAHIMLSNGWHYPQLALLLPLRAYLLFC